MKFIAKMCACIGLISLVNTVNAAPLVTSANAASHSVNSLKIGIVDVQGAILQTNQGQAARKKIEEELGKKRQGLLKQQSELKKMQEDFQSQASLLSNADRMAKQKEFQTKLQSFQAAQVSFEQEARQKEAKALQSIFQNMQVIIQKKSKEKSLDMVFDRSASVLLYASNEVELTKEVVSEYNNEFHVTNSHSSSKKKSVKK